MSGVESSPTDCFVCRKHRGEIPTPGGIIYEDETIRIDHLVPQQSPSVYLGYLMVEPKRHAPGLGDLTDSEAQALGLWVARISRVLKSSEKAEHVYAFVLGDHVPHLHIQVVPRYPGAPRQYWGVHVDEWPDAPHGGPQEIAALCSRLRAALGPKIVSQAV